MEDKQEKHSRLAKEILLLSRNTLLVNLRFLDMALSCFTYHEMEDVSLLTDGSISSMTPGTCCAATKVPEGNHPGN